MAATILENIAAAALIRVNKDKELIPPDKMQELGSEKRKNIKPRAFYDALSKEGLSFICEIKKASPSKGLIDPVFDYRSIAHEYDLAGADAVSCLTEPEWFMGSDDIFKDVREIIHVPMIRKDFTVDEYQIYQAAYMGADAVLLICALMDEKELMNSLEICRSLGIDGLVETHDEEEIRMAVSAGAGIIGVNNRNLKDFSVDFSNAGKLRSLIPDNAVYVAESGVKSLDDVRQLKEIGADAVLMGEILMRTDDRAGLLKAMREV